MNATHPVALARARPTNRSARRAGWLVLGLVVAGFAVLEIATLDLGLAPVAFLILPDLAFLAGLGEPHEPRQVPARAVPIYNLLHQPLVPIGLVGAVSFLGLGLALLAGALFWFAHVALDRAAGYGQRTPDGWQRV
jgi:hypothetical protein